jgi:hypothetical protein
MEVLYHLFSFIAQLKSPFKVHRSESNGKLLIVKLPRISKHILSRKIKYFGHIKRHSGMERTIMEGMVAGRRARADQEEGGFKMSKKH